MNHDFEEEIIFTEDAQKGLMEEEVEEEKEKEGEFRYGFAFLLDFIAVVSLIMGVVGAISNSNDTMLASLCFFGGLFSAIWWHCASIIVAAAHKYLIDK